MEEKETCYAITWIPHQEAGRTKPILVQRGERDGYDALFWGLAQSSYMLWPETAEIVWTHEFDPDYPEQAWEAFFKEFPVKPEPPFVSAAWLSPDGDFYPCGHGAHESRAVRITMALFDHQLGAAVLERLGWYKITHSGTVLEPLQWTKEPTVEQYRVLDQLSQDTTYYAERIRDSMENFKEAYA